MRILYYTSGTTGSGRVVIGASIGNALRRAGVQVDYRILSSCPFAHLADRLGFDHREIPLEMSERLGPEAWPGSELYAAIRQFHPDVLLVLLYWMPLQFILPELACRKVFLCWDAHPRYYTVPLPQGTLHFQPDQYHRLVKIEPFQAPFPAGEVNPLVIRGRDEILPRSEALRRLSLREEGRHCLFAFNGEPGEFEAARKAYSYLEEQGYRMFYSTNYRSGIFPAVDYFSAFDLLVTGAGYNAFWEARYFQKEAVFVPLPRRFEDQERRAGMYEDYTFERNGADQLVELLLGL